MSKPCAGGVPPALPHNPDTSQACPSPAVWICEQTQAAYCGAHRQEIELIDRSVTFRPLQMTAAEIMTAQTMMGLAGRNLASIDWDLYISTIDHAETIAPILDPTMYRDSPHALRHETTELARILKRVVQQWRKCEVELNAVLERVTPK